MERGAAGARCGCFKCLSVVSSAAVQQTMQALQAMQALEPIEAFHPTSSPAAPVSSPEPSHWLSHLRKAFPSCACRGRTSSHAFRALRRGARVEDGEDVEGCTWGTHGVPMARVADKDDGRLQSLCATLYLRRGASARRRVGCRLQRSGMATRWTLLPTTPGRPAPGVRASSASPRSLLSRDTYLIDGLKRLEKAGKRGSIYPYQLGAPPHPPPNRAAAAR